MTEDQRKSLERELDSAMKSGNAEQIRGAHSNILLAMMACQAECTFKVAAMQAEMTAWRERRKGFIFAISVTWAIIGALLGAGVVRFVG